MGVEAGEKLKDAKYGELETINKCMFIIILHNYVHFHVLDTEIY